MIDRRYNTTLFIATFALIFSVINGMPTLRQKGAEKIPYIQSQLTPALLTEWTETLNDPAIPQAEVEFGPILIEEEEETGGTILVEDPMMHNGPIPIEPDTLIPPGATISPVMVEELNVHIDAPIDAMVGDMVKLHAIITGTPTSIKWLIDPPIDDFETLDGGLRAVFSNRHVGHYHVVCSVAGNEGHVDVDTHTFEIVPQPPENPLTPNTIGQLTPQLSVEDLIKRWLAEVRSGNKVGEAHAIAGSFRSIASTLRSGNIPGPDLLRSVEEAGEIAVGPPAFKLWKGFFERVREFLVPLNAARTVFTPEQYANTFENIATVMETLTAMQSP